MATTPSTPVARCTAASSCAALERRAEPQTARSAKNAEPSVARRAGAELGEHRLFDLAAERLGKRAHVTTRSSPT